MHLHRNSSNTEKGLRGEGCGSNTSCSPFKAAVKGGQPETHSSPSMQQAAHRL